MLSSRANSGSAKSSGSVVSRGGTKDEAVRDTARVAKAEPQPVSVRIHKLDGKIQEERTYPRSADPRGSKG
ncbi:MAG: hypothetical protein JWP14_883 [Frankiales bacterium]|nr:hypothetical protein [Frankiales bacterium]